MQKLSGLLVVLFSAFLFGLCYESREKRRFGSMGGLDFAKKMGPKARKLEPSMSGEFNQNNMEVKINGNAIVDEVIEKMRDQITQMGLNAVTPPPANLDVDDETKAKLYNGLITNAGNIHRMGNAEVIVQPLDTKIISSFGVLDALSDYDTDLFRLGEKIAEEGHIQFTVDNITVYQVYKLDHLSQTFTLDEWEVLVGEVDTKLNGFPQEVEENNEIFMEIVKVAKDPLLKIFSVTFKAMVNAVLIGLQTGAKSG